MIKQRGYYDCVLACLAMATGKDYDSMFSGDFRQKVEDARGTGKDDLHEKAIALSGLERGKDFISVYCGNWPREQVCKLLWGRRALIQVPSLNYEGASHYIYWDGEQIHDPSNKQCYRWLAHVSPEWVSLLK